MLKLLSEEEIKEMLAIMKDASYKERKDMVNIIDEISEQLAKLRERIVYLPL
jgi:hypothetical protein